MAASADAMDAAGANGEPSPIRVPGAGREFSSPTLFPARARSQRRPDARLGVNSVGTDGFRFEFDF